MAQQRDRIKLKDLRFEGAHGLYAEEQTAAQPFCINLEMELDTAVAARTGDLGLSVDYSRTYLKIKRLLEGEHIDLLETLAARVAEIGLAEPGVTRVWVEVEKCRAGAAGDHFRAAVAIERGRADGEDLS